MQNELTVNMKSKKKEQALPEHSVTAKDAVHFFADVKTELKRITWTSKDEMQLYLKVVCVSTILFGFGIYAVDLLVQTVLRSINGLLTLVFG